MNILRQYKLTLKEGDLVVVAKDELQVLDLLIGIVRRPLKIEEIESQSLDTHSQMVIQQGLIPPFITKFSPSLQFCS